MNDKLLKVEGLETQFNTPDGVVHAVNGVSLDLHEGEHTLPWIGEMADEKRNCRSPSCG